MLCVLAMGVMASLAGCAMLRPPPAPVPVLTGSIPEPVVSAPVEPTPEPVVSEPVEAPAPGLPVPEPAATVAILHSGGAPAQTEIADRIAAGLTGPAFEARVIDVDVAGRGLPVDASVETDARIVAAVGPAALEAARQRFARAEIVFSQVLDAEVSPGMHGVAATPPLSLQFAAWAAVDPKLGRIGVITSARFASKVMDASEAATAIGARLDHRISTSDRETLYIFRRLAPEIDGFWLAPDSDVLSTAVIGEMLDLAAELEISVLVFSEALLERGGLLSVSAPVDDVAEKVVAAIGEIRSGSGRSLPAEIPLEAGAVQVNRSVAAVLGLPAATPSQWVIREQH